MLYSAALRPPPPALALVAPPAGLAEQARCAGREALAALLREARTCTLAAFDAVMNAVPQAIVPQRLELNPPLWEFGHIAWFADWWIARNPQRGLGAACPPDAARSPAWPPGADAWYDSSRVPHDTRWALPLPGAAATRALLQDSLQRTLAALREAPETDAGLYFFRLALFHEDMHHEALVLMAQQLGFALPGVAAPRAAHAPGRLRVGAGVLDTGWSGAGFAFDNEVPAQPRQLAAFEIDAAPVTNAQFCAFIADGGYEKQQYWPENMGDSRQEDFPKPRYWRCIDQQWQRCDFGVWQALNPDAPAMNVSAAEAEAWCRWAGRRLPSEWEWEQAARKAPGFHWGEVWEWTASAFTPPAGFAPHPYRDYSAPWFGSHRVLRGGSFATQPRMKHPAYRNFYLPARNDLFAGFRSCTL